LLIRSIRAAGHAIGLVIVACCLAAGPPAGALAEDGASDHAQPVLDHVTFATNWVAQAEHGGFYQALADGTYRAYGLDVTIKPGGPNINNRILLPAGKIDFFMAANGLQSFDALAQGVPTIAVAALFQKDPLVLMAHPAAKLRELRDMKGRTIFVSKDGMATYYKWLMADYGLSEKQVKPYTFNPQPFLADKTSVMQGYVTSEPFAIEQKAKFEPTIFLLADRGFSAYSTLIETRRDLVENKPDLVQRFVDASIIGWYHYLYGDNGAANARIKADNAEMSDALIAYSIAKMKEFGIVDSGDALTNGIGAMSDERWADFFDKMQRAGIVPRGLDFRKAYTLRFINKAVALICGRRNRAHGCICTITTQPPAIRSAKSRCTCAASARHSPTDWRRLAESILMSAAANSSLWSAPRAAANRPCCASWPG